MNTSHKIDREIDRYLALLRSKILDQGFSQLSVQNEIGWGRSYISQLLTKQKSLRVEQVLQILAVIGVEPGAFFSELYGPAAERRRRPTASDDAQVRQAIERSLALAQALRDTLLSKELISARELAEALSRARRSPP